MINKELFSQQMASLLIWFDTEITNPHLELFYNSLSESLTEEEFLISCKIIFETTPKKYKGYFPCVKDFVTAARGDQKARALKLWVRLLANVRASKGNDFERNSTQVIKDAIASVGGIQVIVNTPDQELKWIKKDFIDALLAFKQMETRQNYLPKSLNNSQLPSAE